MKNKIYLSFNTPCLCQLDKEFRSEWLKFLNDFRCLGISSHPLKLKIGIHVMLSKNINKTNSLYNETRLRLNDLGRNIISTTVITEKNLNDEIFMSRTIYFFF